MKMNAGAGLKPGLRMDSDTGVDPGGILQSLVDWLRDRAPKRCGQMLWAGILRVVT